MRIFDQELADGFIADGWWSGGTWDSQVRRHATERPDHLSVVDPPNREAFLDGPPRRLTWAEVDEQIDRLAEVLLDRGVAVGDVVALQLPNSVELTIALVAVGRVGAIATPFPIQYSRHELSMLLPIVEVTALITSNRLLDRDEGLLAALGELVPSLHTVLVHGSTVPAGTIDADAAIAAADDRRRLAALRESHRIDPNDCATICWTSGTESIPKGIPRAFGDWEVAGTACCQAPILGPDDVVLNPFPMVNMGGISGCFEPWLILGCTLVQHQPFDLGVFLTQIQDERVNYTCVPPAILTLLLKQPEMLAAFDISSLRVVGSGSAPVPGVTIRGWEERGVEVINFFGSNEGLNLISDRTSVPDPDERGHLFPSYRGETSHLRVRTGDGTTIRLVDSDDNEVTAPDVPGELQLKGPSVFGGYLAGTGKPNAFTADGFYRSGDLFEYTDESQEYLRYRGRANDMIVRGGFNISPAEVENVLQGHPAIADVAVVGVADEVLGDRVVVFAVPRDAADPPTLEQLLERFAEERVAKFKWPERLVIVEALPRNPVGKVLHRELRTLVVDGDNG